MAEKLTINNPEELIDYALKTFNGWEDVKLVELTENFNYHIVLKGHNWDGLYDQRTAEITLKIYNAVVELVAKAEDLPVKQVKKQKEFNPRIVVTVKKGSLDKCRSKLFDIRLEIRDYFVQNKLQMDTDAYKNCP